MGVTLMRGLWCAPLSAFGLALAAVPLVLSWRGCQVHRLSAGGATAWWLSAPTLRWVLHRHPMGRMQAIAIGQIVLADSPPSKTKQHIALHELAHVRQALRWGVLFPFAYLSASLWQAAHGRDIYWENPFERGARGAENDPPPEGLPRA